MRNVLIFLFLLNFQSLYSQYDNVFEDSIAVDLNNKTYKIGNVYIYDYEIIENGIQYKLDFNYSDNRGYKFVKVKNNLIGIDNIHLIILEKNSSSKSNKNQTQIYYFELPEFNYQASGVVDNDSNIWIHPIRSGFFDCLQASPYPYIKKPIKLGKKWDEKMTVLATDEKWGVWKDWLNLHFHYLITDKKWIDTNFGKIECYVTESYANTEIGTCKLISYFSEKYGFVRLEYTLFTGLKLNFWLIDFKENQIFRDKNEFWSSKSYLKK